ncbi:hypothetical protein NDNC_0650 [Candidatus Nasuia deltocephalinicola]|uniref:Cytochrome c553 n=1 Tax=Candidatus Nasuia deltocephalincola TaxID=1160784 RepID=A0A974WLA3_9PROT|nr:hypothetical protein CU086_00020 [Candidatus Nasuia deltocephalinicola]BEH03899.1 hypothetical protein NDNC_0650 [Candidatus Nasuia deltocephalinicola]
MLLKGKNLLKLHNCYFCHKIFKKNLNNFFPKIKNQYLDYLIYCLKQYQSQTNRNNFLMNSQIQNISILDIKKIIYFINLKI